MRFILEVIVLIVAGMWAWSKGDGEWQYIFAIGLPVLFAVIWGVFAVPNDPSRSGSAPVVTPGIIRLVIELVFFYFAVWCLYDLNFVQLSMIFGGIVMVHYLISYDRIIWLMSH